MNGCYSISNIVPWTPSHCCEFLWTSLQKRNQFTIWLLLNEDASWNKQSVIGRLFGADNRPADNRPKHYRVSVSIRREWKKAQDHGHHGESSQRTSAVFASWWWWWWLSVHYLSYCECFQVLCVVRSTRPGHPFVGRRNVYQQKLGHKQAHRTMH